MSRWYYLKRLSTSLERRLFVSFFFSFHFLLTWSVAWFFFKHMLCFIQYQKIYIAYKSLILRSSNKKIKVECGHNNITNNRYFIKKTHKSTIYRFFYSINDSILMAQSCISPKYTDITGAFGKRSHRQLLAVAWIYRNNLLINCQFVTNFWELSSVIKCYRLLL